MKIHYDQGIGIIIDFDSDCIAGKIIGANLWLLPDGSASLNELKFVQDVMTAPNTTHAGKGKLVMDGGPHNCEFGVLAMQFSDNSCVYLVKCDSHGNTVAVYGAKDRLDSIGDVPLVVPYAPTNGDRPDIPDSIKGIVGILEYGFIEKLGGDAVNFNDGLGSLTSDLKNDTLPGWINESDKQFLRDALISGE